MWQWLGLHVTLVCCLHRGYLAFFLLFFPLYFSPFFPSASSFFCGGGVGVFAACSFRVRFFFVLFCLFCLDCLFTVVCKLFCIGGLCKFISISFVMGQVAFYSKIF